MARVLVTDGEQRSTLAVVRSLGRAGHHVVVCSGSRRPLAAASRYAASHHALPDPLSDVEGYRLSVSTLLREEAIDVLIPMTDAAASVLLELRKQLSDLEIPFPSEDVYRAISDKRALMAVASELGVPTPRQFVVESKSVARGAAAHARELGEVVVLKPARSAVVAGNTLVSFGVRVVDLVEDLESALLDYPAEAYPILVQERIEGPGLGAFMLSRNGETVAAFAHRRIREKPPKGGVSVYRESVALREDLREYSERLLGHFGWSGAAMVEFKEEAETGTPYLMEINGRFWGSLQLAIDAGVDFPRLLLELTDRQKTESAVSSETVPYQIGVRTRWLWGDADHALAVLRGRGDQVGGWSRVRSAIRPLVPWWPGDRFEVLRLGDPKPFLRESLDWVRSLFG